MQNDADHEEARFTITKRHAENDAIIIFIDLLGTRALYQHGLAVDQAEKMLQVLLGEFAIQFSYNFTEPEISQNFDVSIFADSIAISPRIQTPRVVERCVTFLLNYQASILINHASPSRAIVTKDAFFSLKVSNPKKSILASSYTTISLCGGRGIKAAHDSLEGLPLGVYIYDDLWSDLSSEQQKRLIPVRQDNLYFIKMEDNYIMRFLPDETVNLLDSKSVIDRNAILSTLKDAFRDQDEFDKKSPWILAHLGKDNEIIRK